MSAKFENLRRQMKVAMMQLGHKPSNFKGDGRTEPMVTRCKLCGATAQIDTYAQPSGEAINKEYGSCNTATRWNTPTPTRIQQAKINEQLFKHLRQLH